MASIVVRPRAMDKIDHRSGTIPQNRSAEAPEVVRTGAAVVVLHELNAPLGELLSISVLVPLTAIGAIGGAAALLPTSVDPKIKPHLAKLVG